jgi:mono/diheme cytochrome c family protein
MIVLILVAVSASLAANADTKPAPTWVFDPQAPGENRPPAGRSLFDFLFTVEQKGKRIYRIPYPFEALMRQVDSYLPRVGSGGTSRVLIPLGRSLQRYAAAPDYFKYPRVIVAVNTEALPKGNVRWSLRDRLFLGYQEKANVIEVISYNDATGRFEFQVVRDYGPGLAPKVLYANRQLCIGCHQNGGPIFPTQLWDETDSNPEVAKRLLRERQVFYGAPVNQTFVPAIAISASIERANLLPAHQLIWREGCRHTNLVRAIRCRASMFTSILQYRLSGYWFFDERSSHYNDDFLEILKKNWKENWPAGLAIASAEIANRNPLSSGTAISSKFDPLNPRPPLEVWSLSQPHDVNHAITGLAEHLAAADVRALDQHLFAHGMQTRTPTVVQNTHCKFSGKNLTNWLYRLWFSCEEQDGVPERGFGMDGWMYIEKSGRVRGMINWLGIDEVNTLHDLELIDNGFEQADGQGRLSLQVVQNASGLHARLPSGRSVAGLEFRWAMTERAEHLPAQVPRQSEFPASARLTVIDDFVRVRTAVAAMTDRAAAGKLNVFDPTPFQSTRVMQALFEQLGLRTGDYCCEHVVNMPPIATDDDESQLADTPSSMVQTFQSLCGTCHRTANRFPPNFLSGDTRRVSANLKHCAQRIFYRLSMWELPVHRRPKSPMPPAHALASIGIPLTQWRDSTELASLRRYVAELVMSGRGTTDLLRRDYETIRTCLPSAG